MTTSIRRLLRLGYEVSFSIVEVAGLPAYAIDLTRNDFRYRHLIDKAVCDAEISDGLAIQMQRLARMMEHHSHFHGDKPVAGAK